MIAAQRRQTSLMPTAAAETRGIPFDYAFRYDLKGEPGRIINSIVTVSIEATFTAVSIGYGVIPKSQTIVFGPQLNAVIELAFTGRNLRSISFDELINGLASNLEATSLLLNEPGQETVLRNGIRLNPQVAELALANSGNNGLTDDVVKRLFQVVGAPSDQIQFKYAIFDEGSGREFQSEPILNIAGLGSANGERPFRHFAQPIIFRPRSTIRMEVTEVSDFKGELHVSLHGYKVLGDQNSPTAVANRPGARRRR